MTRYAYAKCGCGCHAFTVVDVALHEVLGDTDSGWDASLIADRLNRGLPVLWAAETELPTRWPRAIAQGLLVGAVGYGAVVALVAAAA